MAGRRSSSTRLTGAPAGSIAALVRHLIENRYLNGEAIRLDGGCGWRRASCMLPGGNAFSR
jgi:hypothetical protein